MERFLLPEESGARCLDGSPAGFYFAPAPPGSATPNLWVLQLGAHLSTRTLHMLVDDGAAPGP